MRLLWLSYERPPHPDAVVSPLDERNAEFVVALLNHPVERRIHLARQLAAYLADHQQLPPMERPSVPCRTPSGIYHLVSWRLAKWLRHVLPARECVIQRTIRHIQHWQSSSSHSASIAAE